MENLLIEYQDFLWGQRRPPGEKERPQAQLLEILFKKRGVFYPEAR